MMTEDESDVILVASDERLDWVLDSGTLAMSVDKRLFFIYLACDGGLV